MLLLVFQGLCFLIGLVAYYFALFMYEDEQGRLLNRVEQMWIAINDKKKSTGGMAPALLNKVANIVKRAFDRIFGQRLFSAQLIGVSVCYALAALFLLVAGLFAWMRIQLQNLTQLPSNLPSNIIPSLSLVAIVVGIGGVIFVVLGTLPAIKRSWLTILLSLVPGIIIIAGTVKLALRHELTTPSFGLILGLLLSFLSDVALLAVVRISLSRLAKENRSTQILIAIAAQVAIICVLVILPYELSGTLLVKYGKTSVLQGFAILAIFNLFSGISASLFLLTLLFVLLHRAFWPLLDRIVYPLAARQVLGNAKIMAGFGTVCMGVASPIVWRMLKGAASLFGKYVM